MLNAVDKNEKFWPCVTVKVTDVASFSGSITGMTGIFRFFRLGSSTGRLKSPRLNPLEKFLLAVSCPNWFFVQQYISERYGLEI